MTTNELICYKLFKKIIKELFLNDPFYISLLSIIDIFIVGAISKARNKDICLKHFRNYFFSIENIKGKIITSVIFRLKSTGI